MKSTIASLVASVAVARDNYTHAAQGYAPTAAYSGYGAPAQSAGYNGYAAPAPAPQYNAAPASY